ncbi:unnamed protein product, partial [Rotaria sordida]
MNQTSCYSFIFKLSRNYPTASQNRLAKILERVETTLNNLFQSKSITEAQYMAMKIDRSTVRTNYLYFVSDTHKEGIPVQPIMVCNEGPTMGISRYLGRLLGLLFNDQLIKSGQLRPTTLFASFNIDNLCLNFSYQQVMNALEHFLNSYISSDHSIQGMTISTILQLVRLVLDEQYFIYNYKLYRKTAGSASGPLLTIPLVYPNEAFITWNRSEDELRTLLAMANSQFPQPILNITHIGLRIHFRDILITNNNGILQTGVYHELMFDDNELLSSFPDIIQPPIIQDTWKWLYAAFLKAFRYCSENDTFHEETDEIKCQLIRHLQEKQVQFYEDLEKLVARVSIDFLPRSFDELERLVSFDDYFPLIKDNIAVEFKQNSYKIIQEAKRIWLNT